MAATKAEISDWFDRGVSQNATHMIIICDTFDYDDYPSFVYPGEDARKKAEASDGKNMQRVMEVYNLNMDLQTQLNQVRVFNY